ncbi:unnamed protein product [Symbiodinium natans]|uniref:Amidase domain-containing protein n=1 Tax=Symbiodinium natans TaxID=878477 RepID=A0A812P779_9DINO|nr:unnamed protein product [Symbiodinium natans]
MIDVVEQRLSQTDCALNTTPITCFDRARAHAARFQVPKTPPRGFLYGLPVLIKDSEAVAGVRFTEGSPIYASRIPDKSSPLVTQLEERGAIVVGKTNVPEFCAGSQSFNPLFPTTVSPWDTRTTAGGSSGGSCSAVAACQSWLATGSDLGGSLRTPAAFCGVLGFRVSPGRIPRDASTPSGPLVGLHTINGPVGRCVRDVALLLDTMEGGHGWDFSVPSLPEGHTFEAAAVAGAEQGANVRVGFSTVGYTYSPSVEAWSAMCRKAATLLASCNEGSTCQEVSSDAIDFSKAEELFMILRSNTFAEKFSDLLNDAEMKALLKPEVIWNASIASTRGLAARRQEAQERLSNQFAQVQELFKSIDILCVPATLDAAFDADVRYPTEQLGQTFSDYLGWMMPACIVTTFLCPALVMPCGFLEDGRPVGLQLVAPFGEDAALLRAAAALEKELGLPQGCPEPRRGSVDLDTKGPRSIEEAALHHGVH